MVGVEQQRSLLAANRKAGGHCPAPPQGYRGAPDKSGSENPFMKKSNLNASIDKYQNFLYVVFLSQP
jgi:hypothetical protein